MGGVCVLEEETNGVGVKEGEETDGTETAGRRQRLLREAKNTVARV